MGGEIRGVHDSQPWSYMTRYFALLKQSSPYFALPK